MSVLAQYVRMAVYSTVIVGTGYLLYKNVVPTTESYIQSLPTQQQPQARRQLEEQKKQDRILWETIKLNAKQDTPIHQLTSMTQVTDFQLEQYIISDNCS